MDANDRARKKAWKAQQKEGARGGFPAPNELLQSLFGAVEEQVEEHGCDHTLRFTEAWLEQNKQDRARFLGWLREHGGHCDCEVVGNAQEHWEENR